MKPVAGCLSAIVLALMSLPFLFTTGPPPDTISAGCDRPDDTPSGGGSGGSIPAEVDPILATIRQRESGGDYQARAAGSTASGAYQFIDTTWAGYGGYAEAWMAPPDVQDAKAADAVTGILDAHNGDLDAVPLVWYIGWYPAPDDPAWDTIPAPGAGNTLTPRRYRDEWIAAYQEHLDSTNNNETGGDSDSETGSDGDSDEDSRCVIDPRTDGETLRGDWAYPGPTDLFATAPVDAPHHDYPAWDWPIDAGTPLYAIRGGYVISTTVSPTNCLDSDDANCDPCGIGLTIEDDTQTQWTYCHGSQLHVDEGDTVPAGSLILTSGNTGRSTGAHLHLAVRTADGTSRCPQPLLQALRDHGTGLNPHDLPTSGCSY